MHALDADESQLIMLHVVAGHLDVPPVSIPENGLSRAPRGISRAGAPLLNYYRQNKSWNWTSQGAILRSFGAGHFGDANGHSYAFLTIAFTSHESDNKVQVTS